MHRQCSVDANELEAKMTTKEKKEQDKECKSVCGLDLVS
jgi:hypothetical protein